MNLSNNTILITGGSSGIGFELIRQLHPLGNKIIATGRDAAKLQKIKNTFPDVHTIQSDVSDPKAIEALYAQVQREFPSLNILINNAGVMRTLNLHEDNKDLTREIETNLCGPIRMIQTFLPLLKKQKQAAIMNVSSGLAFSPLPSSPVYCATKAGLHSYTQSLRVQMKQSNVKIFELAPPATKTELFNDFNAEDMKGIPLMAVEDMVAAAVQGLKNDQFEIRPGQSNQLRIMSRVAPGFLLKMMSKPVDRMLKETKH